MLYSCFAFHLVQGIGSLAAAEQSQGSQRWSWWAGAADEGRRTRSAHPGRGAQGGPLAGPCCYAAGACG